MAIILDTVELPDDLAWPDRYSWQAVDVSVEYSLTGAAIIQSAEKQAGRPITFTVYRATRLGITVNCGGAESVAG